VSSPSPKAPAGPPLSADELLELLEGEGVTHVIGLPDNDTAPLLDMLAEHPRVRLVRVAREGEAFAIASGLWLGGATPVVVIQNTGLLEAGDALRGTASRMGVPLVMLIGYRGFAKMRAAGRAPGELATLPGADGGTPGLSRNDLVRAELDSVALMTEPTLDAWGVPFQRLNGAEDRARVTEAFQRARAEERPVALLLTHTLG
jgi:sulfopyruvate decarboxylase TPP-binding subunit